ncbi:MAG TPA: hypothetical protein VFQ80_14515, partial [Thermomicrobiales bacterium]|nr:hypothetical protein [Thermomicrobiales bacterium]
RDGRAGVIKLLTMTPYATDRNLGRAYNEAMDLLPEGAWGCFVDHDAMFTTRAWYGQILEAIAFKPDAGAFTGVTNRIAAPWQQVGEPNNHSIVWHRAYGADRVKVRTLLEITYTRGFGGVCMVVNKEAWREVGGFADGLLCVDHSLHFRLQAAGRSVWLIEGLYLYHWRRANGDELPKDTPRAANCPCRGPERPPRHREVLP